MANNNDSLLIQIASLLQGLTAGGGGGAPSNVIVDNQITGFNLEATQQSVLIELQSLLLELQKSTDFDTTLLIDTGNTNQLTFRKEVLDETTGTYVISYVDLAGAAYVPVGPLVSDYSMLVTVKEAVDRLYDPNTDVLTFPNDYLVRDGSTNYTVNYEEVRNQNAKALSVTSTKIAAPFGLSAEVFFNNTGKPFFLKRTAKSGTSASSQYTIEISDINFYGGLYFQLSFDAAGTYTTGSLEVYDNNVYIDYSADLIFSSPFTRDADIAIQFTKATGKFHLWINGDLEVSVDTGNFILLDDQVYVLSDNFGADVSETIEISQVVGSSQTLSLLDINNNLKKATGSLVDGSGTIVTANATQEVFGVSNQRKYLLIQNVSDTDMFINLTSAATLGAGSIKIIPNGNYELNPSAGAYITNESVNVICSVAGKEFTAKEA